MTSVTNSSMTNTSMTNTAVTNNSVPAPDADGRSGILAVEALSTSLGMFKPVGHVMVGLPTEAEVGVLVAVLHHAGWPPEALLRFTPKDTVHELEAMVDRSGAMAGFGYEITLLRRYLELSREGFRWLLVKVDSQEQAVAAGDFARRHGARLAVWYRALTVEELI